jgi:hypothetical protein
MHCLSAKTRGELWFARDAVQFVAASKARIYASDRIGRLLVLDAKSGARLDTVPTETASIKLLNTDTDRIFIADKGGLIQCLHEVELSRPIEHGKDRKKAVEAPAQEEKPAKKEAAPKPAAPKPPKKPEPEAAEQ